MAGSKMLLSLHRLRIILYINTYVPSLQAKYVHSSSYLSVVKGTEGGPASEPTTAILVRPSDEMGRIPSFDSNTTEAAPMSRTNLIWSSEVTTTSGSFERSKDLSVTSGKP